MESSYQAKSKNTFEEYKKCVLALNKKRMILTIVFMDLIFIMMGVLTKNIFFYVGVLLVPVLKYFAQVRPLKKFTTQTNSQ